jgi:hypothetical protein
MEQWFMDRVSLPGRPAFRVALLALAVTALTAVPVRAQQVPLPPGCDSAHEVGLYVKRTVLKDKDKNGVPDRWFVEGDFHVTDPIDPVTNQPILTFNWASSSKDFATNASTGFQLGTNGKKWRYIYKAHPPDPAPGFYRGFMRQLPADGVTLGNKFHFVFFGKGVDVASGPLPADHVLRQSIEIGQLCASTMLCCKPASATKLRCTGPTNGACPQ